MMNPSSNFCREGLKTLNSPISTFPSLNVSIPTYTLKGTFCSKVHPPSNTEYSPTQAKLPGAEIIIGDREKKYS